jgi:hypothetical protein
MKKNFVIRAMFLPGLILGLFRAPASPTFRAPAPEAKEMLTATVYFRIEWDDDRGDTINKGFLDVNIRGRLRLNPEFTPTEEKMLMAMVPYKAENMRAVYRYRQEITQRKPPEGCPALLAEYSGNGVASLKPVPGPGNLMIHTLGDLVKGAGIQAYLPAEARGKMNNHYEFFLAAEKEEMRGRKRDRNRCEFQEASITVPVGAIGIRFLMRDGGGMEGQRRWSSRMGALTPDFQVRVSDLPADMERQSFQPENSGGPVDYELEWTIEEGAFLELQRRVKGEWKFLTDDLKEVAVGERVELRGIILPGDRAPQATRWTVDGNDNRNHVKEFKAGDDRGEAVALKEGDLGQRTVQFHWYRGETGRVGCSADFDGKSYEAEAVFTIEKPDFDVSWTESPDSHFGELTGGNPALRDRWPRDNWPPRIPNYAGEGLAGDLSGLEYNGILFTARNTSSLKGEIQWVQLITETQTIWDAQGEHAPDTQTGLDHSYPCAVGESFYDAPAIPASGVEDKDYTSWKVTMEFELYVMFKPDREDGGEPQWVPVKRVEWGWEGMVTRPATGVPFEKDFSREPVAGGMGEPTAEDADRYPEWTRNSAGFNKNPR